jgi:hypothetical protein
LKINLGLRYCPRYRSSERLAKGAVMDTLSDFFAVRPVFTLYGLRVLWGAYLLNQAIPFMALFTNPNFSIVRSIPALVALLIQAGLNVAIFRLLVEVAGAVLLGRPQVVPLPRE